MRAASRSRTRSESECVRSCSASGRPGSGWRAKRSVKWGQMNRSLLDARYALGVVSQFTLLGDARKGRRPSFGEAAAPDHAEPLVERVVEQARTLGVTVVTGRFRAAMCVELTNDGPVTLLIDTEKRF